MNSFGLLLFFPFSLSVCDEQFHFILFRAGQLLEAEVELHAYSLAGVTVLINVSFVLFAETAIVTLSTSTLVQFVAAIENKGKSSRDRRAAQGETSERTKNTGEETRGETR